MFFERGSPFFGLLNQTTLVEITTVFPSCNSQGHQHCMLNPPPLNPPSIVLLLANSFLDDIERLKGL